MTDSLEMRAFNRDAMNLSYAASRHADATFNRIKCGILASRLELGAVKIEQYHSLGRELTEAEHERYGEIEASIDADKAELAALVLSLTGLSDERIGRLL